MATKQQRQGTRRALRGHVAVWGLSILFVALVFHVAGYATPGDATEFIIPTPLEIEVIGRRFHWEVHYPGADGVLGTDDDRYGDGEVHIPLDAEARIRLRSEDYVYSFSLPHLGLREIAVPEMDFFLEFSAEKAGTFELRGDQLCGFAHPDLLGRLIVGSREAYAAAMARLREE